MLISTASLQDIKAENRKKNSEERALYLPLIQSLPLVAKIEVTNRCNLQCIMCRQKARMHEIKTLDFNLFKRLDSLFPTFLSVYLYGSGEVLTYPHVMDMFDYLRSFEINVGLLTNGMLINNHVAEEWVRKGLYKLSISVDGATPGVYEHIRRGASYDRLFANICMIDQLKKEYNTRRPIITFNFVAMRDNIHELPALVDLAARYGAEEVIVNDLIVFFEDMRAQAVSYDTDVCQDSFSEAQLRAGKNGVKLFLPVPFRFQQNIKHPSGDTAQFPIINPCTEPWSGFWLTAEGIVTPCCYWMKPMGDLRNDDFPTIWNNAHYQQLRRTVNTDHRNTLCRRCAIAGMEKRN